MKKSKHLVKEIYTKNLSLEWERLMKNPFHKLEYETTFHYLKKYLPKKGLVLDAGGGPGRYSIELARLGYNLVLLDLTSANLEFAKKQIKKVKLEERAVSLVEGSITDLSMFQDNSFDAVLCLGSPLSHLHEKQRRKAISELNRVAKKDACLFISVMGKFGYLMQVPRKWPYEIERTQNYRNIYMKGDDNTWGGKGYFHYFMFNELEKLLTNKKLRIIESIGLEGLGSAIEEDINKLSKNPRSWKNWIDSHYALCTHPSIVDTSNHILIVCKKLR